MAGSVDGDANDSHPHMETAQLQNERLAREFPTDLSKILGLVQILLGIAAVFLQVAALSLVTGKAWGKGNYLSVGIWGGVLVSICIYSSMLDYEDMEFSNV